MPTLGASLLAAVFLGVALLYSAVGQAGASGYLAVMGICGVQPQIMKPTALVLNILVATIAAVKFHRAGHFSWAVFWPFALTSVPFSFLGGYVSLPAHIYKPVVGLVLLYAAYRLFQVAPANGVATRRPIPLAAALLCGATIGLISGLTGIGGGIFLTPLLLVMCWAETREAAAVSAAFILVNSVAGLFGNVSSLGTLPSSIWLWGVAAAIGGWIGAEYGSRQIEPTGLRRLLVLVLVIGAGRIMLS